MKSWPLPPRRGKIIMFYGIVQDSRSIDLRVVQVQASYNSRVFNKLNSFLAFFGIFLLSVGFEFYPKYQVAHRILSKYAKFNLIIINYSFFGFWLWFEHEGKVGEREWGVNTNDNVFWSQTVGLLRGSILGLIF
jgi:hypothetical protein